MITKDTAPIIGNAIGSILPYVQEVIVVDTGSTDGTKDVVKTMCPGAKLIDFTVLTNPEAFLHDVEGTWSTKVPGPFSGKHFLGDFAAARQKGWNLATGDYVMWLDSDDVVVGAGRIPVALEDMEREGVDYAMVGYDYETDHLGNVTCRLVRERIARRTHRSYWKQPVHEVLLPLGTCKRYDDFKIVHRRREYKRPVEVACRNLKILVHWFNEKERTGDTDLDPRMLYYLGSEERFIPALKERALEHFRMYVKRSGWDEERGVARHTMGEILEELGRTEEAFAEFAAAAVEVPWKPDPLFGAARVAYHRKDWRKVIEHTERGFKVLHTPQERAPMMMWNPMEHAWRPYVYYSFALVEDGQYEKAIEACEAGLKHHPQDPHLRGNLEAAKNNLAHRKQAMSDGRSVKRTERIAMRFDEPLYTPPTAIPKDVLVSMAVELWKRTFEEENQAAEEREAKEYMETGEVKRSPESWRRSMGLLESLPGEVTAADKVKKAKEFTFARAAGKKMSDLRRLARRDRPDGKLDIAIWTGPAWERWSPKSLETGIGGSETAAVCVARELARRGHRVTVMGDCGEDAGTYDGVEYVRHEEALAQAGQVEHDVFISSRMPIAFLEKFEARSRYLWVHDVDVGDPTPIICEAMLRTDRFLCLSAWHTNYFRSKYSFLAPELVVQTRNGIDVHRFTGHTEKKGNRLIYASSPDRGLERLLELLPLIRERVPDVELHIYYGFNTWEKMAELSADRREGLEKYKHKIAGEVAKGGVFFHGRVGQRELAEAYKASKVWTYPTWFSETSCISAMEAQAAGCVPVATRLAALGETVQYGCLVNPPEGTVEYGNKFVDTVVTLLLNEGVRREIGDSGRLWAIGNLGWDKLAAEWEAMFFGVLDGKAGNLLNPYGDEGLP